MAFLRRSIKAIEGEVNFPSGTVRTGKPRPQGWQHDAFYYWRRLGELHYPTSQLSRHGSRTEWFVEINGELIEDEDWVESFFDALTNGLSPSEVTRLAMLNLSIVAEFWYIEQPSGEFRVYSPTSPTLHRDAEDARTEGRVIRRGYLADPENDDLADCGLGSVLGPAEELLTLQNLSIAQTRSRIAQAGILMVPSEAKFANDADPFGKGLEQGMVTPIRDVSHPSAMVPMKVEMPKELIEYVTHMTLDRPYDDEVPEKVRLAQTRIAYGLDIPPELLFGTADQNHWNAWLVREETYNTHVEPSLTLIGDMFASVAEELFTRAGLDYRVAIKPNPSEILARRSTVRDALDAAELGAVSLEYVRTSIGATDRDAATADDVALIRSLRTSNRQVTVDETAGTPSTGDAVGASVAPTRVSDTMTTNRTPQIATGDPQNGSPDYTHDPQMGYRIGVVSGIMEMAHHAARSRVGAKVRTAVRNTDLAARIDGIDNSEVVATLGLDTCKEYVEPNETILDALGPFMDWWSNHGPESVDARTAGSLFGIFIHSSLETCGPTIPDALVAEVMSGRILSPV